MVLRSGILVKVEWPSYIATTASSVQMSVRGTDFVLTAGEGLYYGVSWSKEFIYVLNRNPGGVGRAKIIKFDKDLTELGYIPGEFLDGHQIHCDGDNLYVTMTANNAISVVDLVSYEAKLKNWTEYSYDVNHINSIWKDKSGFWVSYHTFSKCSGTDSAVVYVNEELTSVEHEIKVGVGNHNVVRLDNLLYICSSGEHCLLVYDLLLKRVVASIKIGYWVRGIGITDTYIILGATAVENNRSDRLSGDSEIYLYDRKKLTMLDVRILRAGGSVYDLRVIGETDYAHNGIWFPGLT